MKTNVLYVERTETWQVEVEEGIKDGETITTDYEVKHTLSGASACPIESWAVNYIFGVEIPTKKTRDYLVSQFKKEAKF